MAQTKYTYSITNDTANGTVSTNSLKSEYEASSIITALDYITVLGDVLDIYTKDALSAGDETLLDGVVSNHQGTQTLDEIPQKVEVNSAPPFAAKTIKINGITKKLFKRVHGVNETISSGQTVNIDFTVPYAWAKFTGAEIFGCTKEDTLNFYVLDTATNTYSGLDPQVYGANFTLNQFGFDVELPDGPYANTSDYDADLYQYMIIRCEYTNNGASSKYIGMNVWLHEVKD